MEFFLTALGLMMIFEGIPYLCFPALLKSLAEKLPGLENGTLRLVGFCIILAGLGMVYYGRSILGTE